MNDTRYMMPLRLGSELQVASFELTQQDYTYRLAAPRYRQFYENYIRPRTAMYRGWVHGYHNIEFGVIPTLFLQKIGTGIVSTLFGKPFILNSKDERTNAVTEKEYKKSNFNQAVKEAYGFALDGGTSLIKWNRDGKGQLRAEAIPMDKFFIAVDAYGDIESVKSYISTYHDTNNATYEYYLCEERFFRYAKDGTRKPFVHYLFYRTSNNVTVENTPNATDGVRWNEIPYDIRRMIQNDYGDIYLDCMEGSRLSDYDKCKMLPFDNDLGCRLVKFTRNIPAFPKLPFGQPLSDLLMNESYGYDALKFFERIELYLSRGRVMLSKQYSNPNDPDSGRNALDPMVFEYYESVNGESHDNKPQGIQLELRAENINRMKQNILNDTAFALNLSSTTVASWLSDGQTQKTATEIEYERTKTAAFINDKIELLQEPLQEMVDLFYRNYGAVPPELNIMPENQTVRSESIKLYSELYDKGHITADMLAKEILGTCSTKEIDELSKYIIERKAEGMATAQPPTPQGGMI